MNSTDSTPKASVTDKALSIRAFGVGNAGIKVLDQILAEGLGNARGVAVNTDPHSLSSSTAAEKILFESALMRGLGAGGNPDHGRALAEEQVPKLKALCDGHDVVFVIAGLGGGAGSGIAPVVAKAAKEAGALVLGFVLMPFDCEGSRRKSLCQQGLRELKATADGVVCLDNQRVLKLIDENTSVLETFSISNGLLAEGVLGIWRLLTHSGPMEIHFAELSTLLRDRHAESSFAVAEATGPNRAREVMEKLLRHPMLQGDQVLGESEAVLVSLIGGPELTMAEINRVMEQINRQCEHAQVVMGAAIDEHFRERLAVTLVATHKAAEPDEAPAYAGDPRETLVSQLLERNHGPKPCSRILPPPPTLTLEKMEQILAQQAASMPKRAGAKQTARFRQTQLPLEIVSKGRFDKSEPTIHKGEDLDVPTYIRRGVALN